MFRKSKEEKVKTELIKTVKHKDAFKILIEWLKFFLPSLLPSHVPSLLRSLFPPSCLFLLDDPKTDHSVPSYPVKLLAIVKMLIPRGLG